MIMRTGSSSKGTMEEEEEEGFGMIPHSIKAEEEAVAAGKLQQQYLFNYFSLKVWRQWRWRLQWWGRWRI